MPSQSFRRILELLEQHGVAYVVVGGVAAVLQGAPVTTIDVGGLKIRVLNLRALIEDKKALGREKDQVMLRLLEAVLRRQT